MILIYTHQLNARVCYVFTHFFETYTDNTIEITDVLETFIAHNGPKFSYTNQKLSNEFFVHANPMLFEQGVREQEIKISRWQTTPVFFPCNEQSAIPYDIFAASFYMLSRYEEHIPHLKDDMNRFSTSGSLASAAKFANKPVVDMWAQQFLAYFKGEFPELMIKPPTLNLQTILEVPVAYAYKSKSVLRTFFETGIDFFNLRFVEIFERFAVRLSFRPDPYDVYKSWIALHQKFNVPTKVMFMFARPSANDRNISIFKHRFINRIKDVADHVPTSLLASYQSTEQPDLLQIEVNRLSEIIHHPLKDIRQHLVRLRFPTTYDHFANLGFAHDYSLQFVDFLGYRAGTGFPFRFYNLSKEQRSNLFIHPVVAHETILRNQRSPRKARRLLEQCKSFNNEYGTPLTLVLTNTIMDERQKNKPWKRMFTEFLENYDK
ncbi:MAG: hypothetical protein VYD39_00690 [Bacteroidota bacterium]|nr:hypothetical protein [Bacteroidota bacterium]